MSAPSTYKLVWSPLPPQRDGSRSSSTSGSQHVPTRGLKVDMKSQRVAAAACVQQPPKQVAIPSPRASICTLLIRGFASLLQLLPQFLYRVFFMQSLPYFTFSVAASLLCFLSLNIPGTYLMLCSVLGLVAFTILSLSAYAVGPNPFAPVPVTVNDAVPPPPPLPPHFSSGAAVPLRRRHSASELPLNHRSKAPPLASSSDGSSISGSSSAGNPPSPCALSLRQRRLLRRQQTAARVSNLATVPEALATEHPAPPPPPLAMLSRPASATLLLSTPSTSDAAAGGRLPELLTADGVPVSDIQLAACVSHLGAGLDGTTTASTCTLETPFALAASGDSFSESSDQPRSAPGAGGGVSTVSRVDSSDSIKSSSSVVAKTMFGRAYEMGERVWPWVTVPVAVACLPVAVVCTLPVAVPLLCTYGAVRFGVSVVRAGASAVCDYVPGVRSVAP